MSRSVKTFRFRRRFLSSSDFSRMARPVPPKLLAMSPLPLTPSFTRAIGSTLDVVGVGDNRIGTEAALPETARSKPLEIWFQDEARVGQQGTLTRIWAERGTRPRAPRDTRYIWSYIFGTVCPERAEAAALIMPHADTQAMSAHLAEIAKTVASGAHALLILDGAGWHGSAELEVPDNITLLKLPPYSPELNPMENVWAYLRANKLAISVFDNYEQIVDRCCEAWNFFANDKTAITSITTRQWAKTVND